MISQNIFTTLRGFATLTTLLTTGLVFTFAIIIMPGIARLNDRGFVRAFQAIDGVIQNGQPLFALVWLGSILSLLAASLWGLWYLEGAPRWLLLAANLIYINGVQLPTFAVNVPLNNKLQQVQVDEQSDELIAEARQQFEAEWNRFNLFRTVCALCVSTLLIVVLLGL
jgi:uncharacterized membrane protein